MATRHCTYRTLVSSAFIAPNSRPALLPPTFLIPAFNTFQTGSFSTTSHSQARRDRNPSRGVSALRHTGLNKRQKLSVKLSDLPKPVLDPQKRSKVAVDEDHGLWDFFMDRESPLATPEEIIRHGRGWTIKELRVKSWNDLHCLWWVCLKARNALATTEYERKRIDDKMYGEYESNLRRAEIQRTMRHIKFVLTERWYAWDEAYLVLAEDDEEVNRYADVDNGESAYKPREDDQDEQPEESITSSPDPSVPPPSIPDQPSSEQRV